MIRIQSQDDILDLAVRKKIIDEIRATENIKRKQEYLKRYDIYKDQTSKWVMEQLSAEGLHPKTLQLMRNRAANVSIARKVVNKLARTYSGGVMRTTGDEDSEEQIKQAMRILDWDDRMKKSDRFRELHKNCAIQLVADTTSEDEEDKRDIKMRILNPWSYDVVEDPFDREKPLVWIISDFIDRYVYRSDVARTEADAGYHDKPQNVRHYTNRKDDTIADAPEDSGMDEDARFVWWSDKYHFTTDGGGQIIESPENNSNPISVAPIVKNSEEQDGQFWAEGGSDLTNGSILINMLLTDMFSIQRMQGWGIPVVKGHNLPETLAIGTNQAMIFNYDPSNEEPEPSVEIVSQQPPLEAWMKSIEQYVALLLTTNNLSPANISTTLDTKTFPSGIAMLVEMSEATNDVENKQKDYQIIERKLWEILRRWLEIGIPANQLSEKWQEVGTFPEDFQIAIKFNEIKPVITEKDKLDIIKLRQDLGIDTELDLIMRDNPDFTTEDAVKKLMRIKGQSVLNFFMAMKKGGHVHRLPDGTISGLDIPGENGKHFHIGLEPSADSNKHRHKIVGSDDRSGGPVVLDTTQPPIVVTGEEQDGEEEDVRGEG